MQGIKNDSVLVIHQDREFRKYLNNLLCQFDVASREAEGAAVANSILQLTKFDIVVAPSRMLQSGQLEGIPHLKGSRFTRLILITGPMENLDLIDHDLLADHTILRQPFSVGELSRALALKPRATVIPVQPLTKEEPATKDYVAIPIADFLTGSEASTDIYLLLGENNFKKVAHEGIKIPTDQISRYQQKGIENLYIRKDDFPKYVEFSLRIANIVRNRSEITSGKKVAVSHLLASNLMNQICLDGIDKAKLQDAYSTVETMISTIAHESAILDLFEMIGRDTSVSAHSLGVCAIATLIAKEVGWGRPAILFKVTMGALFHDIGKTELPKDLLEKPRRRMDPNDMRILESHTIRGRDILLSIRQMPEDVAIIAGQHHETVNGNGYPYGLKKEQIHPLARLIAVADAFCDAVSGATTGETMKPVEAVGWLKRFKSMELDEQFTKALSIIVLQTKNLPHLRSST